MFLFNSGYYGMHYVWWLFWIAIWIAWFSFLIPVRRSHWKRIKENPLDLLQRRLAAGEIKEDEYDRLKKIIETDRHRENLGKTPSGPIAGKIKHV